MVKRSTIGAIVGAIALGLIATAIIRKPSNIIPQTSFSQVQFQNTILDPIDFSAPLPFKSIAQQRAEFDFGFVRTAVASSGRSLSQSSCSGGRSCTSGGDINRAGSKARQELALRGFTDIDVSRGVATAFRTFATNIFMPQLTTV